GHYRERPHALAAQQPRRQGEPGRRHDERQPGRARRVGDRRRAARRLRRPAEGRHRRPARPRGRRAREARRHGALRGVRRARHEHRRGRRGRRRAGEEARPRRRARREQGHQGRARGHGQRARAGALPLLAQLREPAAHHEPPRERHRARRPPLALEGQGAGRADGGVGRGGDSRGARPPHLVALGARCHRPQRRVRALRRRRRRTRHRGARGARVPAAGRPPGPARRQAVRRGARAAGARGPAPLQGDDGVGRDPQQPLHHGQRRPQRPAAPGGPHV
ncbi:MAG: hypothetical protein AVDCRST_MAG40-1987, partial [uncultured Gemmatimonadaceae bacterium]